MIIIDKYLYLSNTITPETYYHVLHLKYKEIEPIVMLESYCQTQQVSKMWSWNSTIEILTPNSTPFSFHFFFFFSRQQCL